MEESLSVQSRIEREREFHNRLAQGSLSYRLLRNASKIFYSKEEDGVLWGPVWRHLDIHNRAVLDYGCGPGDFSCILASRGAHVTGIDISEYLISVGKAEAGSLNLAIEFSVRDAHSTEFPSGTFDYVFGNGILHHLDLPRAYREIARILRPGGKAFFMEPLAGSPLARIVRRATPGARTTDEKPMTDGAIESAMAAGLRPKHRDHFFLGLVGFPFLIFGADMAKAVLRGLDKVDQRLFRAAPGLSRLAWLTVIEFEKMHAPGLS